MSDEKKDVGQKLREEKIKNKKDTRCKFKYKVKRQVFSLQLFVSS